MASELQVQTLRGPTSGDSANTITIPSGQTLSIADGVQTSDMPAGTVLQVVDFTRSSQVANSSDTNIATGLAATITPISATSKLVIAYKATIDTQQGGVSFSTTLFRNGNVVIPELGNAESRLTFCYSGSGRLIETAHATHVETAGSTSPITYEVYFRSHSNVTGYFGYASNPQIITIMEIAQ